MTSLQNEYHPESLENGALWNLTTKELKNLHSSRSVGGAET